MPRDLRTVGFGSHHQPVHTEGNDVIIYTVTLGVREVINGSPIRRVLLGDHSYGVTLQMREGGGREGACDPT